jgi:hypothetical protein
MSNKPQGIWSLVLVPAVITLVVTILRLVGELQGWNDMLFSNVAPGDDPKPGFVGIAWLMPVFGFWFGWKLRRATGEPANVGRAAILFATGVAVLVGGFVVLMATELITMPDKENPAEPTGLGYSLAVTALSLVVAYVAWPRLARTLLVYGLLARIPVVIVTWLALENDWQTHHTKLPVGTVLPDGVGKFAFLAMPQMTVWILATMLLGGLFGCLAAKLASRRSG